MEIARAGCRPGPSWPTRRAAPRGAADGPAAVANQLQARVEGAAEQADAKQLPDDLAERVGQVDRVVEDVAAEVVGRDRTGAGAGDLAHQVAVQVIGVAKAVVLGQPARVVSWLSRPTPSWAEPATAPASSPSSAGEMRLPAPSKTGVNATSGRTPPRPPRWSAPG